MNQALKTFPLIRNITYGPIPTRRLGLSLGINILPHGRKACSFDCPYCQLGARKVVEKADRSGLPTPQQVQRAVLADLTWMRRVNIRPDTITFSGNGEPTLHPRFREIVEAIREALSSEGVAIPIAVLSNAAHLDRPDVVDALSSIEFPILKLDAGNEAMFQAIDRPRTGLTLEDVVRGIRKVPNAILQSMFVTGVVDNSTEREVEDWTDRVKEISPRKVQIYTLDRVPADPGVKPVSRRRLVWISGRLGLRTGIVADLFFPKE